MLFGGGGAPGGPRLPSEALTHSLPLNDSCCAFQCIVCGLPCAAAGRGGDMSGDMYEGDWQVCGCGLPPMRPHSPYAPCTHSVGVLCPVPIQ